MKTIIIKDEMGDMPKDFDPAVFKARPKSKVWEKRVIIRDFTFTKAKEKTK